MQEAHLSAAAFRASSNINFKRRGSLRGKCDSGVYLLQICGISLYFPLLVSTLWDEFEASAPFFNCTMSASKCISDALENQYAMEGELNTAQGW